VRGAGGKSAFGRATREDSPTQRRRLRYNALVMLSAMVLGSNTVGPMVALLFYGPLVLALVCLWVLRLRRAARWRNAEFSVAPVGGRPRSPLLLGLGVATMLVGLLMLVFLLTVRGGSPRFFYLAAALPLLVGLRMLLAWSRAW